jgi:HEPN domain-containing protein
MSRMHTGDRAGHDDDQDELERLIREGVPSNENSLQKPGAGIRQPEHSQPSYTTAYEDEDEEKEVSVTHDVQGALGLYAEAAADMATAGVELGLGRHFACADFCNQAAEKAAQAVSLLRFGRRSVYNHDLRDLGALVGAPPDIQEEMALLTPFHPEAFYVDTPPEEADEVISAQQAETYRQHARHILNWARGIVLNP